MGIKSLKLCYGLRLFLKVEANIDAIWTLILNLSKGQLTLIPASTNSISTNLKDKIESEKNQETLPIP